MMASPQAENGHTDIANEIMEALARIRIPGEAMQVLIFILRKTYGWHKKEDAIPLSQFVLGTGLKKKTICKAIKKLKDMNLLITQIGDSNINKYQFNKDFDSWKPLPKKVTSPKLVTAITQIGDKPSPKKVHSKETTKETTKEIAVELFNQFWELYPCKQGKKQALKAWSKISDIDSKFDSIMKALRQACQETRWLKNNGEYIPMPSTWINGERWTDEYRTKKESETNPYTE